MSDNLRDRAATYEPPPALPVDPRPWRRWVKQRSIAVWTDDAIIQAIQHWTDEREFADLFALSRATPGPGSMLATLIGWKIAGITGALVATIAFYLFTAGGRQDSPIGTKASQLGTLRAQEQAVGKQGVPRLVGGDADVQPVPGVGAGVAVGEE